ncbi:hypothetical protein LR48_Vigan01g069700 [Vigna angularis]|uniref:Uncharacterized protein n=1 Tax=Phaseolus angularis TaxID=3914 RepID=A0A0L9TL31_PHAAN|nr:hypothetical protein LR48_Vigan01g069700 [Vigna angularis]
MNIKGSHHFTVLTLFAAEFLKYFSTWEIMVLRREICSKPHFKIEGRDHMEAHDRMKHLKNQVQNFTEGAPRPPCKHLANCIILNISGSHHPWNVMEALLGQRPSGKSLLGERTSGKSLSVNVEGRAVNPSRFMLKDERTSGKSLSVNVEGRAVNPSRLMLKDERTSGKSLSVNVEGRAVKRSQFGKRSLPQTHKSYS